MSRVPVRLTSGRSSACWRLREAGPPPPAAALALLVVPAVAAAALAAPVAVTVAALATVAPALLLFARGLAAARGLLLALGALGPGGGGGARLGGLAGTGLGGRGLGRLLGRGRRRRLGGLGDLAVAARLGQGGRRGAGAGLLAVPGHLDLRRLAGGGRLGVGRGATPAAGPALGAVGRGLDRAGTWQLRLVGRRGGGAGLRGLGLALGGLGLAGRSPPPAPSRGRRGHELDTLGLGDDRADQVGLAESLEALDTHGRGDRLQLRQDLSLEDAAFGSCHVHLPCEAAACRLEEPGTVRRHPVAGSLRSRGACGRRRWGETRARS